jgi:hypothetical protein
VEGRYANTVLAQFIVVAISPNSSTFARQSYEEKCKRTNAKMRFSMFVYTLSHFVA